MPRWCYNWNESMTYEEIQNAINNVIDENADHQITAKSLNLLLNDMMTFVKENINNDNELNNFYIVSGDKTHNYIDSDGKNNTALVVNQTENKDKNKKIYEAITHMINNKSNGINILFDYVETNKLLHPDDEIKCNFASFNLFMVRSYNIDENIINYFNTINIDVSDYLNTNCYQLIFISCDWLITVFNDGFTILHYDILEDVY